MAAPLESTRDGPAYVVECASCQQPWEVKTYIITTPTKKILIPGHAKLNQETSHPEAGVCAGAIFGGIGMGERGLWEREWSLTHGARPLPAVLDGSEKVRVEGGV